MADLEYSGNFRNSRGCEDHYFGHMELTEEELSKVITIIEKELGKTFNEVVG